MKAKDSIHLLLFDLVFLIQIEMRKVVKNTGTELSPIEILILRTLVELGDITQQELVEKLSKDKAQITRLLQGLEKKQLIFKKRNPNDSRSFVVTAKDTVKVKMLGFIQHEKKLVQKMLKGASDEEVNNMIGLLQLMKNNIKSNDS